MTAIPAPLTNTVRITSLAALFIVALGSGTNYVFSAYSPQLGARLKISHTQLNIVGLAGNAGVYSSGLLWAGIVDSRGPRFLLSCGFIFLLGGYSGIRHFYDSGLPREAKTLSDLAFIMLVFSSFLTGCGAGAGLAGTVNLTATSFPDRAHRSATGLVVFGLVLSAFFFSRISDMFFANDTSRFLLLLSLGSSFPMIIGFFLVRPIPLPGEGVRWDDYETRNNSKTRLLDLNFIEGESSQHNYTIPNGGTVYTIGDVPEHPENDIDQSKPGVVADSVLLRDLENRKVWRNFDFWLLVTIFSLLSGTGLMYINNIGSISQFLYAHKNLHYKDIEASRWQAAQVSIISLMNFLGRVLIGWISDFVKNKYDMPRSYSITLVASLLLISQIAAANVTNISYLWIANSLLGLAHGSALSLFPTVCLEWFGIATFSENWTYLAASPIAGGTLFSIFFGQDVDSHKTSSRSTVLASPSCSQGLKCYVGTVYLTIGTAVLAVLLSIQVGYKDRQRKISAHPTSILARADGNEDDREEIELPAMPQDLFMGKSQRFL